jgi:PAS domain-containing protein
VYADHAAYAGRISAADPHAAILYKQAFQALPVVSFLTDHRAVILDASEAAATFLNLERTALRSKRLLHFVARADTRAFRVKAGALLGDPVEPFSVALRPRHGKPCPMTLTAARVSESLAFVWIASAGARMPLP